MSPRQRPSGPPFTLDFPEPLPVERDGDAWRLSTDGHDVRLSNLPKVYWPDEGITKGDLLAYYWNVRELIVPHIAERPLTMKRMPDGIAGDFFFEKSAPSHTPDWIGRCLVPSEDSKRGVIDYCHVSNGAGLLWIANLGCIEIHPLHARCQDLAHPDYLFFDLDPFPPYTYEDVLAVARHIRVLLENLGLTAYPKTSGATGMQIYLPLRRGAHTSEQARAFVGACGELLVRADPDKVTMAWKISDRDGKIFVDRNMNRSGANIAAAYSVRPEPRAPVSTPLTWDEVEAGALEPQDFRMDNALERFVERGDLFAGVLDEGIDLSEALDALGVPDPEAGSSGPRAGASVVQGPKVVPDGPLPRTAASSVKSRTSEEIAAASKDPKLFEYVRRRDFGATPEPAPAPDGPAEEAGNTFVIQKHRASALHYDLRLEQGGALASWAVPRGLPVRRGDRRMAVATEDHPLEYASFAGTIPEGHYGAGEVRIFDEGHYDLVEWTDDKVSFVLHGRRYAGLEFHLVKTRQNWLVLLASDQAVPLIAEPTPMRPMLAETAPEPFDDPDWWFEPKLDGLRCLATLTTGSTTLASRSGRDITAVYPELHMMHEMVDQVNAVLDGELIAFDDNGKDSFEVMQTRMNLTKEREIARAAVRSPVAFVAFDLLMLDGHETTSLALEQRRELLDLILEEDGRIQEMAHAVGDGIAFTEQAKQLGLEGVVAKRLGSVYTPGTRTSAWRKIKLITSQDCVIVGWTPGKGERSDTFGALLVAAIDAGKLRLVGQVGTGFTDRMLRDIGDLLAPLTRDSPATEDPEMTTIPGSVFVEPSIVCEVAYQGLTRAGKMRGPRFRGLRPDKLPEECVLDAAGA
jgi:bifunctional non-homologous end joining protein LigD